MRSNLFWVILYDLRILFIGIVGVSFVLFEKEIELDKEMEYNLIKGIKDDFGWFIWMVENLFFVMRISEGLVSLEWVLEVVEEIVGEVVGWIKKCFVDWIIYVKVLCDFFMVLMDGMLIE